MLYVQRSAGHDPQSLPSACTPFARAIAGSCCAESGLLYLRMTLVRNHQLHECISFSSAAREEPGIARRRKARIRAVNETILLDRGNVDRAALAVAA